MSDSRTDEAKARDDGTSGAPGTADVKPMPERKLTEPMTRATYLSALIGGLAGTLLTGAISIWLFYAKWPVERDKMLAETRKIAEETAQAKLAQEFTIAQTRLSETQDKLAQLQIETKQIDRKYEETLKQTQADTATQEGKLIELQRRQAEIKTKALPGREDSAVIRESVDAANAITDTIHSVVPRLVTQTRLERLLSWKPASTQRPLGSVTPPPPPPFVPGNKVRVSSQVTNTGRYPFALSIHAEFFDAKGNDIPGGITYQIEGLSTPSGEIQPNQTLAGTTTLVFPEDWVDTKPGVIQIKVSYKCQTTSYIVDSLAKQIQKPGIREALAAKSTFTLTEWATVTLD